MATDKSKDENKPKDEKMGVNERARFLTTMSQAYKKAIRPEAKDIPKGLTTDQAITLIKTDKKALEIFKPINYEVSGKKKLANWDDKYLKLFVSFWSFDATYENVETIGHEIGYAFETVYKAQFPNGTMKFANGLNMKYAIVEQFKIMTGGQPKDVDWGTHVFGIDRPTNNLSALSFENLKVLRDSLISKDKS